MNTNKRSILYISLISLLALGFSSCSPSGDEHVGYDAWDEDRSAALDEREIGRTWEETGYYERWDTNRDGIVDEHEWSNARQRYLGSYEGIFGDWDADANNELSEEEVRRGLYEYHDVDRSRTITEDEYETWFGDLRD